MGGQHHHHNIQSEGRNPEVGNCKTYSTINWFSIREHFSESMDSMPGLAAFDRPAEDRNKRGFGFQVGKVILKYHKLRTESI